MGCVQGHRHVHLTVMPPLPQIISSINVIIWLDRVQSWIFNSAIEGVHPPPSLPPHPHVWGRGKCAVLYVSIALSSAFAALDLICISMSEPQPVKVKQVTSPGSRGRPKGPWFYYISLFLFLVFNYYF